MFLNFQHFFSAFVKMFLFSGLWLISIVPQVYGEKTFSSAGEVFIHFAMEESGQMGSRWETRIIESTKRWSVEDAHGFLSFLKSRIGGEDTVKRIKSVSYFRDMSFTSFKHRVFFYEEYLGSEGITNRLRISLSGFHVGDPEEIRAVVKYLEDYIVEKEAVKEAMKRNLQAFAIAKLNDLKVVVKYLEDYIGEKEAVKEAMKRSFQGFAIAKFNDLEAMVGYVEGRIGKKEVLKKMRSDLQSFTKAQLSYLQAMEKELGREKISELIRTYNLKNDIFKPGFKGTCPAVFTKML